MGVTADRNFIVTSADNSEIVYTAKDKVRLSTSILFCCDSPRCHARHEGKATFLKWEEEAAQKDIANLPEGFFRLIKIQPDPLNGDYNLYFCSPTCVKDYLVFAYVPPKSPRQLLQEKSEELKVNAAAQKAIDEQNPQMKLPFDKVDIDHCPKCKEYLHDEMGHVCPLPDSDATGFKDEQTISR